MSKRYISQYEMGRLDWMAGISYAHYESEDWKRGWLAARAESQPSALLRLQAS